MAPLYSAASVALNRVVEADADAELAPDPLEAAPSGRLGRAAACCCPAANPSSAACPTGSALAARLLLDRSASLSYEARALARAAVHSICYFFAEDAAVALTATSVHALRKVPSVSLESRAAEDALAMSTRHRARTSADSEVLVFAMQRDTDASTGAICSGEALARASRAVAATKETVVR